MNDQAQALDRLLADVQAADPAFAHKIIRNTMFVECSDGTLTWDAVPHDAEYTRPIAVIEEHDGEDFVVTFDEYRLRGLGWGADDQVCYLIPGDCRGIPQDAVRSAAMDC